MISLAECREILGPDAQDATDEEVELARGALYLIAEAALESEEKKLQEDAA